MLKNFLKVFIFSLFTICLISSAKAATREELLKYMPEEFLDSVSEEKYQKLLTLDTDKAMSKTVTIEDNSFNAGVSAPNASYRETNAKRLSLNAIPYDNINYSVSLSCFWKYMPAVTSFDVTALRFENLGMATGTASGVQLTSAGSVSYGYKGTNMVYKDNGFGISMNILDDKITSLQTFIQVDVAKGNLTGRIYGAYEHAMKNVTLAQSQNYTLNLAGMGNVINFSSSVWGYYDNMDGVDFVIN